MRTLLKDTKKLLFSTSLFTCFILWVFTSAVLPDTNTKGSLSPLGKLVIFCLLGECVNYYKGQNLSCNSITSVCNVSNSDVFVVVLAFILHLSWDINGIIERVINVTTTIYLPSTRDVKLILDYKSFMTHFDPKKAGPVKLPPFLSVCRNLTTLLIIEISK